MACCALFIFVIAQWVMLWRRFRAALGRFRVLLASALLLVLAQGAVLAANWTAVEAGVHDALNVALMPAPAGTGLPAAPVLCGTPRGDGEG